MGAQRHEGEGGCPRPARSSTASPATCTFKYCTAPAFAGKTCKVAKAFGKEAEKAWGGAAFNVEVGKDGAIDIQG